MLGFASERDIDAITDQYWRADDLAQPDEASKPSKVRLVFTADKVQNSAIPNAIMIRNTLIALVSAILALNASSAEVKSEWISLFNGKDLTGWTPHGKATWSVQDGLLVGIGGMGHIYTDATCTDFEAKGMFRVTSLGKYLIAGFTFAPTRPRTT